jgi:hypothetical protein
MPRAQVRAVCHGCGSSFLPVREGSSYCPGCSSGDLDAESHARWRACLAGYGEGWHLAIAGASLGEFELAAAGKPDGFVEGMALARRKAAEYLAAGLPRGRPPGAAARQEAFDL